MPIPPPLPPSPAERLARRIDAIRQSPGLDPSAALLIDLAIEAQLTGTMPDLSALAVPSQL